MLHSRTVRVLPGPLDRLHRYPVRCMGEVALQSPRTSAPADSTPSVSGRSEAAEKAWEWFRSIGSPQFHVAPMVDQSELPFRLLCRRHGSTAAYTPMLHSRIFSEDPIYRADHFTTCAEDRPLLAQFCANDPATLLAAAEMVQDQCDAVDLNLGCPQRIARKGRYGAFLMDDWPLVSSLISHLATHLRVPVTCKIRIFDDLAKTVEYARMVEASGASLLAVHGRTREQKQAKLVRANWDYIKAVREAVSIPVLANGNIQHLRDAYDLMAYTGAAGVMSAESLLDDPALFSPARMSEAARDPLEGCRLMLEYVELTRRHNTPLRMVKGHAFKMLGDWLHEHTDLRDVVARHDLGLEDYEQVTRTLMTRIQQSGRSHPQPRRSSRADDPPLYSTSAPLNPLKDLGIGLEEPHMQQPVVV